MFWKTTIKNLTIPPNTRVIVTSDIHGNLPFFKGLLEKVKFTTDDILILLGDILEKGTYNLELLRYIMELEKTHQIHSICGNCDGLVAQFFQEDRLDDIFFRNFLNYPKNKNSIILQMGRESGVKDLKNLPLLRETIRKTHRDIWDWVDNLPTIIDTENYFFVHGGVPNMEEALHLNAWDCMKNDYFYDKNYSFSKYMVVGHCPTTLYHTDFQDASPIIDEKRKIISIDGGCVLKLDGQLNALILENDNISYTHFDGLTQVEVLTSQEESENPLNIRWGHTGIEIIENQGEFTLCKHLETGQPIKILTDYLKEQDGKLLCEDATDYLLPITKGDIISLSHPVKGGFLGKKNGVTGWYFGEYKEL